jgi:hypothetical protein
MTGIDLKWQWQWQWQWMEKKKKKKLEGVMGKSCVAVAKMVVAVAVAKVVVAGWQQWQWQSGCGTRVAVVASVSVCQYQLQHMAPNNLYVVINKKSIRELANIQYPSAAPAILPLPRPNHHHSNRADLLYPTVPLPPSHCHSPRHYRLPSKLPDIHCHCHFSSHPLYFLQNSPISLNIHIHTPKPPSFEPPRSALSNGATATLPLPLPEPLPLNLCGGSGMRCDFIGGARNGAARGLFFY